jgi:hypothetical protein
MRSWWIGGALTVGWLGLAVPLWAQAPLPEPLPLGSPPPAKAEFGPLNPQQAPPGPPANLGIPAGAPGAFMECPPTPEEGCYGSIGGMLLRRQKTHHQFIAGIDRVNTTNLDTGEAPLRARDILEVQDARDVDPNMSGGVRGTIGYLCGNEAIEFTGYWIPENSASAEFFFPGRIDAFFTNPPIGFEGDNGLWLQADRIRTTLRTSLANAELNYRWWNSALTGGEAIFGIRYIEQRERLSIFTGDDDLTVLDINGNPDPTRQATYQVDAHNHIVGPQLGLEYHNALCSWLGITLSAKGTWGVNWVDSRAKLNRGDGFQGFDVTRHDNIFSHVYEGGAFFDIYVLERMRVRAGYNLLWLVDVAEAVREVNFDLANQLNGKLQTGSIFYHGPVIELQFLF